MHHNPAVCARFSALQRAENSSTDRSRKRVFHTEEFQCSSASRKFLNFVRTEARAARRNVSVLFSEPKIPQPNGTMFVAWNASVSVLFSEPKIPQPLIVPSQRLLMRCFSALQRAENSSTAAARRRRSRRQAFQCSSASRKFLNSAVAEVGQRRRREFQCSSASRKFLNGGAPDRAARLAAEFQCSSASRKFLNPRTFDDRAAVVAFQCSSASRKFLNNSRRRKPLRRRSFQCSSASRKFLNFETRSSVGFELCVSVLFSEPKIPQLRPSHLLPSVFSTAMIALRRS